MNNIIKVDFQKANRAKKTEGQERLSTSLAGLVRAQQELQSNVKDFEVMMGKLNSECLALQTSNETYLQNLRRIDTKPLYRKSRNLARMMDDCLAS